MVTQTGLNNLFAPGENAHITHIHKRRKVIPEEKAIEKSEDPESNYEEDIRLDQSSKTPPTNEKSIFELSSKEVSELTLTAKELDIVKKIEATFGSDGSPSATNSAIISAVFTQRFTKDFFIRIQGDNFGNPLGFRIISYNQSDRHNYLFLGNTKTSSETFARTFILKAKAAGSHKQFYHSLDIESGKSFAAYLLRHLMVERLQKESFGFETVKNIKGCVRLKYTAVDRTQRIWLTTYCDGGTLGQYLKEPLPSPEHKKKMLIFFTEVSGIISRFHEKKIVHGDLHKLNLMWKTPSKPHANGQVARVIDFGLIERVEIDAVTKEPIPLNSIKCAKEISSPENLQTFLLEVEFRKLIGRSNRVISKRNRLEKERKENPVGFPHDVWGLGATMHLAFFGKLPPWLDNIDLNIPLTNHQKNTMISKMKTGYAEPRYKASVEHVVWEMLQFDQSKRPTMSQVHDRLEAQAL